MIIIASSYYAQYSNSVSVCCGPHFVCCHIVAVTCVINLAISFPTTTSIEYTLKKGITLNTFLEYKVNISLGNHSADTFLFIGPNSRITFPLECV